MYIQNVNGFLSFMVALWETQVTTCNVVELVDERVAWLFGSFRVIIREKSAGRLQVEP